MGAAEVNSLSEPWKLLAHDNLTLRCIEEQQILRGVAVPPDVPEAWDELAYGQREAELIGGIVRGSPVIPYSRDPLVPERVLGSNTTYPRVVADHGEAVQDHVDTATTVRLREPIDKLARHATIGVLERHERKVRVTPGRSTGPATGVGPTDTHSVNDTTDAGLQSRAVSGRDGAVGTTEGKRGGGMRGVCLRRMRASKARRWDALAARSRRRVADTGHSGRRGICDARNVT
jgi:hypothetical protein